MTDQPNEEGRPIGPERDPARPLDPMTAALAAWKAMVDLVGAAVAASERRRGEGPSPAEAERWLAMLEAIVECLETAVVHTTVPGVSADDLIVAKCNLRRAREHYSAYKHHLGQMADDRATARREAENGGDQ